MTFHEYRQYDATGLAGLIRQKEVTPAELLEIAIDRADSVNPKINAIIYKMYDEARASAVGKREDAPFAGVPFVLKDLAVHVKGVPLRSGCKGYETFVSPDDSEIVRRFRKAGLVFMGKTNTPEFGLTPYTEPELFGPSHNPWDLTRTTGGSSGGSAAAVSAGIVPLATASDGGGSIRIPASCCGLFGLKVSRGRTPLGEYYGEMWAGAVVEHCVSRSVRDSAALLDAICGETSGAPYIIKEPVRPYLQEITLPPGKLHIAFSTQHPFGHPIDQDCLLAVQHTARLLESLGHTVTEVPLPYPKEMLTKAFFMIVAGETAAEVKTLGEYLGRKPRMSDVELNTWGLTLLGRAFSASEFAYQKRKWNELSRQMGQFHHTYDLLLTPTLATAPFKIGEIANTPAEDLQVRLLSSLGLAPWLKDSGIINQLAEKIFSKIPFTPIANMTGQPSMSVPLYWSPERLPIGVMFTARYGAEDTLLRLAAQLEQAQPWMQIVPEIS